MINTPRKSIGSRILHVLLLAYAGSTGFVLADLKTSIQGAQTALALGDQILSNVLDHISAELHHNPSSFFSEQGTPLVRSYKLPSNEVFGIGEMNPIDTVLYGFVSSTNRDTCPGNSTTLFDGCLTQDYDDYLAVQVTFKSRYESGNLLPLPLVGARVLFLAYSNTSTPIKETRVNSQNNSYEGQFSTTNSQIQYFICYNPNGLGNLITGGHIRPSKASGSSLGSFNDCISRGQNDNH